MKDGSAGTGKERSGFLVPEPRATLVLDEGSYAGAEIEARLTLSPKLYFAGMDLLGRIGTGSTTQHGVMTIGREIASFFAEFGLISWNLCDPRTREPIPATEEGLASLDIRLLASLFSTWIQWLGRVPLPLPEGSTVPTSPPSKRSAPPPSSMHGHSGTASSRRRSIARTSPASSVSVE